MLLHQIWILQLLHYLLILNKIVKMEELIVRYISSSQGMFHGIENIVDQLYEWAIFLK